MVDAKIALLVRSGEPPVLESPRETPDDLVRARVEIKEGKRRADCVRAWPFGGNTNYRGNALKTKASIAFGKVAASRKADPAYLQRPLNSGRSRIMLYNTVDGMVGILEPTIFAGFETVNHKFYPQRLSSYLSVPNYFPAEVKTDDSAKKRWRAFLTRVAEKNDPVWSAAAKTGLQKLK